MNLRWLYFCGLALLLGAAACAQILGIDDARPGWMAGSGGNGGNGGTSSSASSTTASSATSSSTASSTGSSSSSSSSSTSASTGGTGGSGSGGGDAGAPQCLPGTTMGCEVWAELFGGLQDQQATGVAVDQSGNIFVTGYFQGAIPLPSTTLTAVGTEDTFLLKLNPAGTPLWGQSFGASGATTQAINVAVDSSGNAVVYGTLTAPVSFGGPDVPAPGFYVAKFSGSGQPVWSKGVVTTDADAASPYAHALAVTPQGDVVIGGESPFSIDFGNVAGNADAGLPYGGGFIVELNGADGTSKWITGLGPRDEAYSEVDSIAVDSTGNLLVGGYSSGTASLGPGSSLTGDGLFIGKLAPNGTPIWQRQMPASNLRASVSGLAIGASDAAIIAGTYTTGSVDFGNGMPIVAMGESLFLASYDSMNNYGWSLVAANAATDAMGTDAMGDVILAGSPYGPFTLGGMMFSGTQDTFIAKLSGTSSLVWNNMYTTGMHSSVAGVAVTPNQDLVIVGAASGNALNFGSGPLTSAGGKDAFVAKLSL